MMEVPSTTVKRSTTPHDFPRPTKDRDVDDHHWALDLFRTCEHLGNLPSSIGRLASQLRTLAARHDGDLRLNASHGANLKITLFTEFTVVLPQSQSATSTVTQDGRIGDHRCPFRKVFRTIEDDEARRLYPERSRFLGGPSRHKR